MPIFIVFGLTRSGIEPQSVELISKTYHTNDAAVEKNTWYISQNPHNVDITDQTVI